MTLSRGVFFADGSMKRYLKNVMETPFAFKRHLTFNQVKMVWYDWMEEEKSNFFTKRLYLRLLPKC